MANDFKIGMDQLGATVRSMLEDYREDVASAVSDAILETGKRALKTVREKSPKGRGDYAKGWRMAKSETGLLARQTSVTIYNAKLPGLAHLLEKGHQKAGGGRVEGIPHISIAEEEAIALLPKLAEQKIGEVTGR